MSLEAFSNSVNTMGFVDFGGTGYSQNVQKLGEDGFLFTRTSAASRKAVKVNVAQIRSVGVGQFNNVVLTFKDDLVSEGFTSDGAFRDEIDTFDIYTPSSAHASQIVQDLKSAAGLT
jgi:hypothetical protein